LTVQRPAGADLAAMVLTQVQIAIARLSGRLLAVNDTANAG